MASVWSFLTQSISTFSIETMKSFAPVMGVMFAGALLLFGLVSVIDTSEAGAALGGNIGGLWNIVPSLVVIGVVPLLFIGLVVIAWNQFK